MTRRFSSQEFLKQLDVRGKTIVLDLDGTLLPEGTDVVVSDVRDAVRALALENSLFLLSNGPDRARLDRIARELGVPVLPYARKPSTAALKSLGGVPMETMLITGDQFLTDGLLAARSGIEFVRTPRVRSGSEGFFTRLRYGVDDAAYRLRGLFLPLPFIDMLRPSHWVKNILIFSPLFFAGEAIAIPQLETAAIAFVVFCLVASSVYVINDLNDAKRDATHPLKRFRPLASGRLGRHSALVLLVCLLVCAATLLYQLPLAVTIATLTYVAINLAYSTFLKHMEVIDLLAVASGYVIRVIAGGAAVAVTVSPWIILCVFALALFLVVGKRRAELANAVSRTVLKRYSMVSLDYMLVFSASVAVITYGIYAAVSDHAAFMVYSVIFVAGVIMRLLNRMLLTSGGEYPEKFILEDRVALTLGIAWVLYVAIVYYGI